MNRPIVRLVSATAEPLEVITLAIEAWHNPDVCRGTRSWSKEYCIEKFRQLLKAPHQTPLEYVNLVWTFENVSRAFQQQLTRHRIGFSYSIQSLRIVDVGSFAYHKKYHMPKSVKDKKAYHNGMLDIQDTYLGLIRSGESVEDARGILPLNIFSPITMACTYRALLALLKQRMCITAQEEWREVVSQMRYQIAQLHPVLAEPIDCACKRFQNGSGVCTSLHKKVAADE